MRKDSIENMRYEKGGEFDKALTLLIEKASSASCLSVREIVDILSRRGYSLILIFLSLPFCQPFQIPGVSIPFGILVAFLGLRMIFGRQLWLPKKLLMKPISSATIQKIAKKSQAMMNKISYFIHPRLPLFCMYGSKQILSGLLVFLLGLALALPLPIPFTNLAVGWSLLLTSLGLLYDDGLLVLIGYAVSILTLLFFVVLAVSITKFF